MNKSTLKCINKEKQRVFHAGPKKMKNKLKKEKQIRDTVTLPDGRRLFNAIVTCEHDVQAQWSGVKYVKCDGWFCY